MTKSIKWTTSGKPPVGSKRSQTEVTFESYIIVKPKSEVQSLKVKTKRTWADTKITWATTHPTHPSLLSIKESSDSKVLVVKVAQNGPLDLSSQKNLPGGQRDQGQGVVLHV